MTTTDLAREVGRRGEVAERGSHRGRVVLVLLLAVVVVIDLVLSRRASDSVFFVVVLWLAAAAAWAGALRGGARRLAGIMLASGLSLSAVGDTLWAILVARGEAVDVSVADVAWFACDIAIAVALLVVLRQSGAGSQDLDFTLDAATIVVGSLLLVWSVSSDVVVATPGASAWAGVVAAAYPIADALLVALVIRVLTSRAARRWLHPTFAIGLVMWLVADILYLFVASPLFTRAADLIYLCAPVLLAFSTWKRGRDDRVGEEVATRGRPLLQIVIAVGPLMVPPTLAMVGHFQSRPDARYVLAVSSLVLAALAGARAVRLVRAEQHALAELKQARDDAMAASRAKSTFLSTMSHELRTPLTSVLGAGELLAVTDLDDFQRDMVHRVCRSSTDLRSLVEVVLDYSRLEAGTAEAAAVSMDLRHLVTRIGASYGIRARSAGLRLECQVDPALPECVTGDPERVLQVLGHLLDNAVKFTPEGSIRLSATSDDDGSVLTFAVEDSGIGIPEQHLAAVFDAFTQVDPSSTRNHGGTGIGLAVCRRLTALMGGTIAVSSRLDAGSRFVVRLPLRPADCSDVVRVPRQARIPG
ncbi:Signal transduction histidine kinase [Nocardioides exalbidus]|uniref:Circadian input-output histidine kinase CikA n=1 Tax=Nocardioides exalbidus TaxID=402596 RepID=A0A1H4R8C5_9ACTN|nr:ATP-binding protein [Nocardioides exalbidus]SEC28149.1 Signal transduction histidine kinase [Nocardioides exalbidus]